MKFFIFCQKIVLAEAATKKFLNKVVGARREALALFDNYAIKPLFLSSN